MVKNKWMLLKNNPSHVHLAQNLLEKFASDFVVVIFCHLEINNDIKKLIFYNRPNMQHLE